MSTLRFDARMSDMDALMWGIEKDPLLRSTITAVALLDRAPDHERMQEKVERGLAQIPRLRERPVPSPGSVAPPRWIVDPNFDLGYHMRFIKAPGDGSLRDLLDLAAPIAMQSFDRARPLWEFVCIEGLQDGKAALIQKVHHAVTDGVGGIQLALMLLDMERDPAPATDAMPELPAPEHWSDWQLFVDGVRHERRRQLGIARRNIDRLTGALRDPVGTARRFGTVAGSAGRLLEPAFTPLSPVMKDRSLSVRFDTVRAPLAEMKAAAKRADGRLNDAFVAAVAGGLARYHRRHGADLDAVRMSMPINIRAAEGETVAGNQFVPARFPLPLNIDDPLERMAAVRRLVADQRDEPALSITEPVAGVLNRLPLSLTTALFGSILKGIDVVTSNVPGVPFNVFLCGAAVEANFAFGPMAGAGANITLLSYVDEVHVGINTDPAAVPDPEVFVECIEEGFAEVLKAG